MRTPQHPFSEAEMADLRGRATFAAKASVILAAVARQEEIAVSPADLDAKIEEIAELRGQTVQAIRGYLSARTQSRCSTTGS